MIRELTAQTRDALVRGKDKRIARSVHRLFYDFGTRTWSNTHWLGTPAQTCRFDLRVYQELLHDLRPGVIVECTALSCRALVLEPHTLRAPAQA